MTKILKKYLVAKWWLPILFFGLSIILFISETILPNTNFGFYSLAFFTIILLISAICQFFKGKIVIAMLQLSIVVIPLLFFGFIAYIFAGIMDKPNEEIVLDGISPLIEEKTDLIISKDFEVIENLIEHTEGAFDSDYSITLIIKFKESNERNIVKQILNNAELNSSKGLWENSDNGFNFKQNDNKINRYEPFHFEVDTLNNKMELYLTHL